MGSVQKMRRYVGLLNRLHEDTAPTPTPSKRSGLLRDFLARRRAVPGVARAPVAADARCRRSLRSVGSSFGRRKIATRPDLRVPTISRRRSGSGATGGRWTDPRMMVGPPSRALSSEAGAVADCIWIAASDPDHAGNRDCAATHLAGWHPGTDRSVRHRALPRPPPAERFCSGASSPATTKSWTGRRLISFRHRASTCVPPETTGAPHPGTMAKARRT